MPERRNPVDILFEALEATLPNGQPDWTNRVKAAVRLTVLGERVTVPQRREGVWHEDGD